MTTVMAVARRCLLLAGIVMLPLACSGESDNSDGLTTLVEFAHAPTLRDEAALVAVGGRITLRAPIARVVVMTGEKGPADYLRVAGVVAAVDVPNDDPTVSAFISVDRVPTPEDVDFVLRLGALTARATEWDSMISAARLPLDAVPRLSENPHFITVEVDAGPPLWPQPQVVSPPA